MDLSMLAALQAELAEAEHERTSLLQQVISTSPLGK